MNTRIILGEAAIFCALFTALVFAAGKRKTIQIHNYPPEIQEEYFKTHPRIPVEPLSGRVIALKIIGIVLFSAVLWGMARLAGAACFSQGFWFALGMMALVGAYDTFFLDWVLFANLRCFRLPGTEHMDEAYHKKWFHLRGLLFPGSLFGVVTAFLVGGAVALTL